MSVNIINICNTITCSCNYTLLSFIWCFNYCFHHTTVKIVVISKESASTIIINFTVRVLNINTFEIEN